MKEGEQGEMSNGAERDKSREGEQEKIHAPDSVGFLLRVSDLSLVREGVKKKRIYLGLCPKLWVGGSKGGSKVPNFFSENNHSVIFTANIQKCPKTCNT